jgi:hypothetical protein
MKKSLDKLYAGMLSRMIKFKAMGYTGKFSSNGQNKFGSITKIGGGPIPPPPTPPGGTFTPTIVSASNVSAALGIIGFYSGNVNAAQGVIDVTQALFVTTDNSGLIARITIDTPLHANFTATNQAGIVGDAQIIIQGNQNTPGNIGTGVSTSLVSNTTGPGAIDLYMEGALPNTQYRVDMSYSYVIQSTPSPDPDFYKRESIFEMDKVALKNYGMTV